MAASGNSLCDGRQPGCVAMRSLNKIAVTRTRSRDGALPNSDMRGSETFDDKMFQVLTQRAHRNALFTLLENLWRPG